MLTEVTFDNCYPLVDEYCALNGYRLTANGIYHATRLTLKYLSKRQFMEEQDVESAIYAGVYDAVCEETLKGYC